MDKAFSKNFNHNAKAIEQPEEVIKDYVQKQKFLWLNKALGKMEREYKLSHSVVGISVGSPQKLTMESVSQIAIPSGPYQTFDYTSRNG